MEGECRDDGYTQYSGNSQDSTAKSNPHSMDSGIATRSTRSGHPITALIFNLFTAVRLQSWARATTTGRAAGVCTATTRR